MPIPHKLPKNTRLVAPDFLTMIPDSKLGIKPKQQIHLLSIKASSQDGYEKALHALQGTIVAMATTNEHLIVVTQ